MSGFKEDEVDLMKFQATCIRFGRIIVNPLEDVELSKSQLRIVFRADKLSISTSVTEAVGLEMSTVTDHIRFEANPKDFVKTIYSWHKNSATILFRVTSQQFARFGTWLNGLLEKSNQFHGGRPNFLCLVMFKEMAKQIECYRFFLSV